VADWPIDPDVVLQANRRRSAELDYDYESLGERLARRGIAIDAITERLSRFGVAIPTWGVGTGGTRFARFRFPASPRRSRSSRTAR
jgi:L-rhamnose isomerase/sugar isomerase